MTYPDPYGQNPYATGSTGEQPAHGHQPAQSAYPTQQYGQQQYAPQQFGQPEPPSANGGWAVATIIFFWPLAFIAVSRAFSVYPLWAQGRYAEAEAASASVKKLGMISLIIVAALIAIYIVVVVIFAIAVGASSDTTY